MVRFKVFRLTIRRLVILLGTTLIFAGAIWFVNAFVHNKNVWNGFSTDSNISTFFCERTDMSKIIRQPINTFSNIIYWIVAIVLLRRGWKDQSKRTRYNIISANPFYSITLGLIMLYTFCASTFFHASLIRFAGRLDFSAVNSLSLFPLMYFTHRVWMLSIGQPSNIKHSKSLTTLIIVFSIAYLLLTFCLPPRMENYVILGIIIIIIAFGIIVEKKDPGKTNHYYLITCIVAIGIAVMFFGFDIHKILCNEDSFIQPHSLWHIFSGISVFYFYMYIRSERNKI